jgi:hypothetical protein
MDMMDDDEIDIEALERFEEEHPIRMSPEDMLESTLELIEFDGEGGLTMAIEITHILDRWERAAASGKPIGPELKRFEAEACYTKHGFVGAEGVRP